MASQDNRFFTIKHGPSKFDFMVSLFDGTSSHPHTVTFTLDGISAPCPFVISSIQREDGSGESWNFEGNLHNGPYHFPARGYFSTKTRQGSLRFEVHHPKQWDEEAKAFVDLLQPQWEQALDDFIRIVRKG